MERVHMGSRGMSSIFKGILTMLRLRWREQMLGRPYRRPAGKKERMKTVVQGPFLTGVKRNERIAVLPGFLV